MAYGTKKPESSYEAAWRVDDYEFARISLIVTIIDETSMRMGMGDKEAIEEHLSALETLWDNLKVLNSHPDTEKNINAEIENCRKIYGVWKSRPEPLRERFPNYIAADLKRLKYDLFRLRQALGLSIRVVKIRTPKQKVSEHYGTY